MQIIDSLNELNITSKTAVALGNFDGVHIGHRKIMHNALEAASANGFKSLCFTFSNHPFNFIMDRDVSDPAAIKLICSEEEKIRLIEDMGFDILVNVPFDEHIMKMRAHDFFEDILSGRLSAGYISVGFNYSYGARAEGNPEMLRDECGRAGILCSVEDAVMMDGEVVSSTLIREMIAGGDMEKAAAYLGRPFTVSGKVEHGARLGSANGIPTANIAMPDDRLAPPSGVYFTRVLAGGSEYKAVSNLGCKPTVSDRGIISIETNVFGWQGDLYEKEISVYFDHFSRPERRFASQEELFAQISRDCEDAVCYHSEH